MTPIERMDIFRLLYVEVLKPSAIAAFLNRAPRPASSAKFLITGVILLQAKAAS
jgi:hypothetical protein